MSQAAQQEVRRRAGLTGFRSALRIGLGLLVLGLCSCRSAIEVAAVDPFVSPRDVEPVSARADGQADPSEVRHAEFEAAGGKHPDRTLTVHALHRAAAGEPSQVQPAAHAVGEPPRFRVSDGTLAAARAARQADDAPPFRIDFAPNDPRVPLFPGGFQPVLVGPGARLPRWPDPAPRDEYLCDGGDRGLPVHYDAFYRYGLETEDTVAEYVDHQGRFHMRPSNRVCIYAPRFNVVRSITASHLDLVVDRPAAALDTTVGHDLRSRTVVAHHAQRAQLEGLRTRSRPSGLDTDAVLAGFEQRTRLALHEARLEPHLGRSFLATGQLERSEAAWLAYGIQAAAAWTRNESPVITAQIEESLEVRSAFRPQEIIGREQKLADGELRIVKLADRKAAQPGDVVTFVIRYDNIGDLELFHVRIVDNLTPRLEYVEGSATSDRDGDLVFEENGEGSFVLRFDLDEPLPGRTGGVITFQTRVR